MKFMTRGLVVLAVLTAGPVWGAEHYVDAARGSAEGDGSAARPWRSLQAVFDSESVESRAWDALPYKAGRKLVAKNPEGNVKAGDTIWLRDGYYGALSITGLHNTKDITIAAVPGQTPRFRSVQVRSSSHWKLAGLHVSPAFGAGKRPRYLISLESHNHRGPIHDVTVEGCVVRSAEDTSGWSVEDWNTLSCSGVRVDGTRMTIRGNRLKNVDHGIMVGASHSLVEENLVVNFAGDGMRGLGDHSVFQYNTIKNCYNVNGNHDDGFQSYSQTADGVGKGEVVGIVLRGNTIINFEDPDQLHRGTLQGIGCFDGMFVDWFVENNVIVVDHYHGITLLGARGCRIVNNTVVNAKGDRPGAPWISVKNHKKGMPSSECVVRNNVAPSIQVEKNASNAVDHNVIVGDASVLFVDAARHDLRLRAGSPAIDAGTAELAPALDRDKARRPQGKRVDAGAYEYAGEG